MSETKSVSVWQVQELIEHFNDPTRSRRQDLFVLATSALEACEIVGQDERRSIVTVQELCELSQLPGDKYQVSPKPTDGKTTQ